MVLAEASPGAAGTAGGDHASIRLHGVDGKTIDFSNETPLVLRLQDGSQVGGRLWTSQVSSERFEAQTVDGRRLSVPLAQVSDRQVKVYSPGKTGGLTLAIILGTPLTVLLGTLLILSFGAPSR